MPLKKLWNHSRLQFPVEILNRCQLDRNPDSFPLTLRSLIKGYIVYYFACKLARARNEMCFSVNYTHYNNSNNK